MKTIPIVVMISGLLFACAPPPPAAPAAAPPAPAPAVPAAPVTENAPADRFVTIRTARCNTFLALSNEDRAAASMFYMGYQASRSRVGTVNVAMIPVINGVAIDLCSENPDRTVAGVFAQAYAETRRY